MAIDDQIYHRLPCFIIATVDKFASLPWVGETGGLFGQVDRYDKEAVLSCPMLDCICNIYRQF